MLVNAIGWICDKVILLCAVVVAVVKRESV